MKSKDFASRVDGVAPFQVMAILEQAQQLAAEGIDVIHLEVGEPDFSTPEPVSQAGIRALQQGKTRYTPALGLPELRQRISDFYQQKYQLTVPVSRIAITPGASGALLLLMAARLQQGDELLLGDPGYPCNRHFAHVFEANSRLIPTSPATHFQLSAELIQKNWQPGISKAVLLASPANPTGTLIPEGELKNIIKVVDELGGELWVDEIYHGLIYGEHPKSALEFSDRLVVINSFSKYFGMTGWRLGWMVTPQEYIPVVDRLAQNLFLAPATPSQHAALAAFDDESIAIMESRRAEFEQRRDYLLSVLPDLGFKIPVVPEGAFYIYADASELTDDAQQFCQQLLEATGVALTPGLDFGHHNANHYIRFAYTTGIDRLQQAVERIRDWLQTRS